MKYLFIITGIAYGHLTREESIINRLKKLDKKAEIIIAGYGSSYDYFRNDYKFLELKPMFFPDDSHRVKFFKTLIKNYRVIISWMNNWRLITKSIDEFSPNVVISDWEPFAIFVRRCKYLIWNYKPRFAKIKSLTLLIEKVFIDFGYFISRILGKEIILPSIKKEKNIKNYIYTSLIVRKNPDEARLLIQFKDSILVMIGGANFGLDLARKIKNISRDFNEKFVIFGYKCRTKNCIGYKEFRHDYLDYLKSCKAVITLGGYSGISESVFFRKPNLAFPIHNWIEQQAVAEEFRDYIEIGDIKSSEEKLKIMIKEFLINIPKIKKKLNTLKLRNGADEIAKFIYQKAKS